LKAKTYPIIIIFSILSLILIIGKDVFPQDKSGKYTIIIHGGAGFFPKDSPEELRKQYINSLTEALNIGKNILSTGGRSIDAVEKVINYLYSIFEETKIRDVYYNYDNVIVLKESLKDKLNKINIINNYNNISLGNVRTVLLNNFVHELRLNLATITLFISLWLPAKSYLLQDCAAQVRDGIFPWTLNHLS